MAFLRQDCREQACKPCYLTAPPPRSGLDATACATAAGPAPNSPAVATSDASAAPPAITGSRQHDHVETKMASILAGCAINETTLSSGQLSSEDHPVAPFCCQRHSAMANFDEKSSDPFIVLFQWVGRNKHQILGINVSSMNVSA